MAANLSCSLLMAAMQKSPYQYVRELPLREITDIQRTLMEAYLELSYIKPRNSIRVKELCSAAYVARSTFYVHYESLEELLEHIENNFINRLLVYTLGMLE